MTYAEDVNYWKTSRIYVAVTTRLKYYFDVSI